MTKDGIIQFNHPLRESRPVDKTVYNLLEVIRRKVFNNKWIGVYPDGVGYGNLSCRLQDQTGFYITASQTGHLPTCLPEHYCQIHDYDYQKNQVSYSGCLPPSSESLTHAMFYELDDAIAAVLHIHHPQAWSQLKKHLPCTHEDTTYGTIEMAMEIKRLYQMPYLHQEKCLVMAGHKDGLISFGKDLVEAFNIMQQTLERL
ncbi:MAG: class II aldolase/adducin family protein [Gammaproteobacteria bacterium]|nr:class II aldolase/adducin family protein [Gammaproteobacteria bacterium]